MPKTPLTFDAFRSSVVKISRTILTAKLALEELCLFTDCSKEAERVPVPLVHQAELFVGEVQEKSRVLYFSEVLAILYCWSVKSQWTKLLLNGCDV